MSIGVSPSLHRSLSIDHYPSITVHRSLFIDHYPSITIQLRIDARVFWQHHAVTTDTLRDDLLRARIASFTSEDLLTVNAGTTITHETAGLQPPSRSGRGWDRRVS